MSVKYDALDALIMQSGDILMDNDAEYFDSIDTSNVNISPRFSRKMHRKIRRRFWQEENKQLVLTSKRIAAAVLVACAVLFASAMSIGAVREAIWSVIVEWYDRYISISYVSDNPDSDTPTTIEEKREPTYLPDDYEKEIKSDSPISYWVEYSVNSERMLSYQQKLAADQITRIDNENCTITYVEVNQHEAVLAEYTGDGKYYSINWSDGEYSYLINCFDNSITSDMLIKIAEQIK